MSQKRSSMEPDSDILSLKVSNSLEVCSPIIFPQTAELISFDSGGATALWIGSLASSYSETMISPASKSTSSALARGPCAHLKRCGEGAYSSTAYSLQEEKNIVSNMTF